MPVQRQALTEFLVTELMNIADEYKNEINIKKTYVSHV